MMIPVPKLKDHSFALGESRSFGASLLEDEDRQEDLGILVQIEFLDPFVKLSLVDMLKCTNHTRFMIEFWFS